MIAITIDCEQWNPFEIRGKEDSKNNNTLYSFNGNKKLLEIFDKKNIKATFFITGVFAEEREIQVRKIAKKHEIACHGYNHFYRGNENLDLNKDVSKAKEILEKISRKKISGFRAPQMQFSKKLIKILEDNRFRYDSSIHSAYVPFLYGKKENKKFKRPFKIGKITEIPASSSLKFNFPISWIVMRNLPLSYSVRAVRNLLKRNIPVVLYMHSWEFFEIERGPSWFYTRNTGDNFCRKLEKFIDIFKNEKFVTMEELI
jgi:peptidoglycan/xylan/chitin deacetylase (PgdA/CDA1 family)